MSRLLAGLLSAGLAACPGGPGSPDNPAGATDGGSVPDAGATACSADELGALYQRYVEPFVSGRVPQSCSNCHMTGIEISLYAQDDGLHDRARGGRPR
jgi:hypothetical protein